MDVKNFYQSRKRKDQQDQDESVCMGSSMSEAEKHLQINEPARKRVKCVPSVLQVAAVWETFPRQQMAFEFARKCRQNVAVFAFESEEFGREGQRKYLVTTYYEFGQRYLSMESRTRHYYEVIAEDSACWLYFDMEFKKDKNPGVNCISVLDTFVEYVCYQLYDQYGLICNHSNILDLDSTTPVKFSRHLIFHLPSTAFRNNIHAGEFVHLVCDQLRSFKSRVDSGESMKHAYEQEFTSSFSNRRPVRRKKTPSCPKAEDLYKLFVLNERNEKVLICDEAVYTRNRNFRLYLSSKLGKDVHLKLAKENKFVSRYGEDSRRSRHFNILMDSLVCNVSQSHVSRILDGDSSSVRTKSKPSRSRTSATAGDEPHGYSLSPYPTVDHYITSQLTRGGVQGHIRRWTFFPQGKQLVYDIQGNRWCENIQRAHKSNNIMIIADLNRGVYYQKCHDPECKRINFRSNEYPIPDECNPLSLSESFDLQDSNPDAEEASEVHHYIGELTYQQLQELDEPDTPEEREMSLNERTSLHCRSSDSTSDDVKHYIGVMTDKDLLELDSSQTSTAHSLATSSQRDKDNEEGDEDTALDNILEAAMQDYERKVDEKKDCKTDRNHGHERTETSGSADSGTVLERRHSGKAEVGEDLNLSENEMRSFCEDEDDENFYAHLLRDT